MLMFKIKMQFFFSGHSLDVFLHRSFPGLGFELSQYWSGRNIVFFLLKSLCLWTSVIMTKPSLTIIISKTIINHYLVYSIVDNGYITRASQHFDGHRQAQINSGRPFGASNCFAETCGDVLALRGFEASKDV